MAFTPTAVFPQTPQCNVVSFTSVDGAAATKTVYTGAANCSKVISVSIATNATESHLMTLSVTRNSTSYALGAMTVNASSGYGRDGTTKGLSFLTTTNIPALPVDSDGQPYIFLTSVDTLSVTHASSFTASHVLDVVTMGADF